jgi:hypothetical protein
LYEFVAGHFQAVVQLYRHLLLLLENELVVWHVLLRVRLEIAPKLVQVETVFVCALLTRKEKLTEFWSSKWCTDEAAIVHELINRLNTQRVRMSNNLPRWLWRFHGDCWR